MILLLEDNAMFAVPLMEIAQRSGESLTVVESAAQALAALATGQYEAAVLSMRLATVEFAEKLDRPIPLAAYGPHVEGEMFQTLRRTGVRDVWPNSKLFEKFPVWIARLKNSPV